MKEYFKGHKDSTAINEYLNGLDESSNDFHIVYQLRKMGEEFIDGTLTVGEVNALSELLPASSKAEAFIHQMKCYTFYSVLCDIALGKNLSTFGQRVKGEIEHPSFCKPVPQGKCALVLYKLQRIWKTRWKHPLVFNEPPFARIITRLWSVVRMERIVKD